MTCKSRGRQHASFALTWFQPQIGVRVTEYAHILGDAMIASSMDSLSRNRPVPELDATFFFFFVNIEALDGVLETLRLCDPAIDQNMWLIITRPWLAYSGPGRHSAPWVVGRHHPFSHHTCNTCMRRSFISHVRFRVVLL